MAGAEVVEVDMQDVARRHPGAVWDFEQALWAEQEPHEPPLAEPVALWLATRQHANERKVSWAVGDGGPSLHGVAHLALPTVDNLHLGIADIRVHPEQRRRGIATALLQALAAHASEAGRTTLIGRSWDLVPAGEPFARRAGATAAQIVRRSDLDLTRLDRDLVDSWLAPAEGVRHSYELSFVDGLYPEDQYAAIAEVEEVMDTAPHDDLTVEHRVRDADWVAQREESQATSPGRRWTIFVRQRSTGRLVGYTQVFFYPDWPGHVDQGNTGVHPYHRGRGLGRWLKAAMLDRVLREHPGSFRVRTTNAFSNAPMLAINDELGFVVTATQTVWQLAADEVLERLPMR